MNESCQEKLQKTAERLGVKVEQLPRNVAVIMDGNGRWAQKRGLHRAQGHREGGKTVEKVALSCVDLGLENLTLYSFSTENWRRPEGEVNALMHLYAEYMVSIRPTLMRNNVKLVHLGELAQLPSHVQEELLKTVELTSGNTGMVLALALNYSSRAEITHAVQRIAQEYKSGKLELKDIDQQCISNHLYTANLPDPDLLVRTANEMRVSNFLLWQISYSEFYVTETLWPDLTQADMEKAILAYAARERRFGAIKPTAQQ
jgi:undecaprenyl diphosphate synthase